MDRQVLRDEIEDVSHDLRFASEQRLATLETARRLETMIERLSNRQHDLLLKYHGCHNCAVSGIVECGCKGKGTQ